MNFEPLTDEQIDLQGLMPEGFYPFEVINAEEKISNSGNPMIALKLKVWDADGKERGMLDWIMPSFARKLKHFCKITDMLDKYSAGTLLAEDCEGKSGHLRVANERDKDGKMRNRVADYVKVTDGKMIDDDIPF